MYTVSSCIWYFPSVTLSVMLLLGDGEVGECREATFTKECEWLVTERTRMCDSEMRGSLLERMQALNLPHVFTFDFRKTSRSVTLQSNTVVPHRSRASPDGQLLQVLFSSPIGLYFLFQFVILWSLCAPFFKDLNSCLLLEFGNQLPTNLKLNKFCLPGCTHSSPCHSLYRSAGKEADTITNVTSNQSIWWCI